MKHNARLLNAAICIIVAGAACPAFAQLPAMIGDIDGFGMESGLTSLLNSFILMPPYLTSANMDVPGATCDTATYLPFSRDGANYPLQMGDFLPDVNHVCLANVESIIPLPMSYAPSDIRTVCYKHIYDRPANYASYTRRSNPWLTTSRPNTDCWDNREDDEVTSTFAKFTDITISTSFDEAWPHLMGDYPHPVDDAPITFQLAFGTAAPTEALYLYFPIGDYDAGEGATVTITSMVGNDTEPHVFNLTKQDNRYQQGLIQGIIVELYNGDGSLATCDTPFYLNWSDFAVFLWGGYLMGFTIELNMGEYPDFDPYYAIDYVVIDDDLSDYGVLMVGPNRTYTTIQDAIDAAANGNTILVDPGTYYENVDFGGKTLALTKRMGCGRPVIDGGGTGSAITLWGTEGHGTIIRGFDITNGSANQGGGICANGANVQVEDCRFYDNSAIEGGALYNTCGYVADCTFTGNSSVIGGAVSIFGSSTKFNRCVFGGTNAADGNTATMYAGAVFCISIEGAQMAPSFERCSFYNNQSPSGGVLTSFGYSTSYPCNVNFTNCVFWKNAATSANGYGGVFYARENSSVNAVNCTFASNTTVRSAAGGAAYITGNANETATLSLHNCLAWGDTANGAVSEIVTGAYGTRTVRYSVVQGEADNYSIWFVGSSLWNPNYISTAAATLNLRPQNALTGAVGSDASITPPTVDIVGNPRPMPNGTLVDWGAYETFSY